MQNEDHKIPEEFSNRLILHPMVENPVKLVIDVEEMKETVREEQMNIVTWAENKQLAESSGYTPEMKSSFAYVLKKMTEASMEFGPSAKLRELNYSCNKGHTLTASFDFVCPTCGDRYYPRDNVHSYKGHDVTKEASILNNDSTSFIVQGEDPSNRKKRKVFKSRTPAL